MDTSALAALLLPRLSIFTVLGLCPWRFSGFSQTKPWLTPWTCFEQKAGLEPSEVSLDHADACWGCDTGTVGYSMGYQGIQTGFGQGTKSSLEYICSSSQSAWPILDVHPSFGWKDRGRCYLAIDVGHFQWSLHQHCKAAAIWTPEMVKTDLLTLLTWL